MARLVNRLTPLRVKALTAPGRYADGGRLYLIVSETGSKSWAFMYRWHGRTREAGLGAVADVSLKAARAEAEKGGKLLTSKPPIDPLTEWRGRPKSGRIPTFAEAAAIYLEGKALGWRADYGRQMAALLTKPCETIARLPVNEIDTADVLKVIKAVWAKTPDTAGRLRVQIEGVLNSARALGYINSDCANPARWRGHLESLLPKRKTIARSNFAALPYAQVPAFVAELRDARRDADGVFHVVAYALEFLILTGARAGEALGARWSEIDLEARTWTLPAARTKAQREHIVPLSAPALAILEGVRALSSSPLVFPGARKYAPASSKNFERLLQRLGQPVTTHGFRSSFRDWAGDETEFAREIAEAALSHAVGDETERRYRRGHALERRRALMDAWAAYVTGAPPRDNVVELRRA
ncbi:MAG TPA: integrase arm-type DNA-binding domain-containing protein [Roseiarcus sp.]|jgi:integrase